MTVAMPGSERSMELGSGYGRRAELAIWTDQSQNRCTLRLAGRLAADTVRLLDSHVDLLGCRSCEEVCIDLAGLVEMDEVGARVIVGLGHYVAARGGRFRIDGASPALDSLVARAEVELSA